jgi:hypothetical protein
MVIETARPSAEVDRPSQRSNATEQPTSHGHGQLMATRLATRTSRPIAAAVTRRRDINLKQRLAGECGQAAPTPKADPFPTGNEWDRGADDDTGLPSAADESWLAERPDARPPEAGHRLSRWCVRSSGSPIAASGSPRWWPTSISRTSRSPPWTSA